MCKHSSILTEETCATCQEQKQFEPLPDSKPVYEGMTKLDREAVKLGRKMKGFKFKNASRRGARGTRRGRKGTE